VSRRRDLESFGIRVDDEGRADGFLVGREAALADWADRKESRAFEALAHRLYVRKWVRKVTAERGSSYAKLRAAQKRHRDTDEYRESAAAYERNRRREKYKRNPIVCVCIECGSSWCLLFRDAMRPAEFCSVSCGHAHRRRRRVGPSKRACSKCGAVGHARQRCPSGGESPTARLRSVLSDAWQPKVDLCSASGVDPHVAASLLPLLVRKGFAERLVRRGERPLFRKAAA
jgi:hypothetical protein